MTSEMPAWPGWLQADGSGGVPHFTPGTGDQCRYLAIGTCSKCGWADPDPAHAEAAMRLLASVRRAVVTPQMRAGQLAGWKAAAGGRSAEQRRGRHRRPAPGVTGYVVRPRRRDERGGQR